MIIATIMVMFFLQTLILVAMLSRITRLIQSMLDKFDHINKANSPSTSGQFTLTKSTDAL